MSTDAVIHRYILEIRIACPANHLHKIEEELKFIGIVSRDPPTGSSHSSTASVFHFRPSYPAAKPTQDRNYRQESQQNQRLRNKKMGNCFSKGSSSGKGNNFRGEGRTLGSSSTPATAAGGPRLAGAAPAATPTSGGVISYGTVNKPSAPTSASVPASATTRTATTGGGGGRTLGGSSGTGLGGATETATAGGDDPKSKAAQAAMVCLPPF